MYKGGKNHIRATDILNSYMCEKGEKGGGNQREYQRLTEQRNASEIVNILSGRRQTDGERRGEALHLGGDQNGGEKKSRPSWV